MTDRAIPTSGQRIAELSDKLYGYPLRGTDIGGGFHSPMVASWDGIGAVPAGWTSHKAAISGVGFSTANGAQWIVVNGSAPTLTPAERTELISLLLPGRRASSRWSLRTW